jgi:hypothetical protein
MGTKNKQRRAAKAKRRAREQARRAGTSGRNWSGSGPYEPNDGPRLSGAERVRRLLAQAISAPSGDDFGSLTDPIVALARDDAGLVDRESEGALLRIVGALWDFGWQPAELVRHARRCDAGAGRLVAAAVAADHVLREPRTLHPRWAAQVEALDLPPVIGATGWLAGSAGREWSDRVALVTTVVVALQVLRSVGRLNTIIPPPGAGAGTMAAAAGTPVDDPVLVRVRALLAQAESTTFTAEAEAFTAKAQELMARHAIDTAVVWAHSTRDERPTTIRLAIDDPYADIKALLLQHVANHSRCKAIRHGDYGLSSVVGFASDVAATEMLFTSLLVQAQAALQAEAARAGPGARTRSRSFRSSFLMAYAHRIDQRLGEINAAVATTAAAEHDGSLLPVLAARDGAVDDVVAEVFGSLQTSVVRGGADAAGWARGTLAADLARLNLGDLARTGSDQDDVPALALG